MSDFICRDEFEELKDHTDNQHVSMFNKLAEVEISMMDRATKNYRWLLGIFITVFIICVTTFTNLRNTDIEGIAHENGKTKELVQKSIEQSLVNSKEIEKTLIIVGAGLDKSNSDDKAILDKLDSVKEKNDLQIQYLEDKIEQRHQ